MAVLTHVRHPPEKCGQLVLPSMTREQRESINRIFAQFGEASRVWESAGRKEGSPEHIEFARAQSWLAWFMWYVWEDHAVFVQCHYEGFFQVVFDEKGHEEIEDAKELGKKLRVEDRVSLAR